MNIEEQKNLFKEWLQNTRSVSTSTLISYTEGILEKLLEIIHRSENPSLKSMDPNMYSYQSVDAFDEFVAILKNDPNFDIVNKTGQAQSGWVSTPLNHYRKFLLSNENEEKISNENIELLREKLIKFYKTQGIEVKETGTYTALKYNKNIAEIHKLTKQTNRFRIVINYDLLSNEFKDGVRRVPDSFNWTNLNGEFWIDSEKTLNSAIQKINNILSNINKNEIVNTANIKQGDSMKNIPLNLILYGPPGTGKTYSVRNYINEILGNNPGLKLNNEDQRIADAVKCLNWYSAIALSMYRNGKNNKYKVADMQHQKLIKAFAKTRDNNNLRAIIWGQLQTHTATTSITVNYGKRMAPFIFDKTEDSEWHLTEEGIKFVEENLSEQLELLDAKNKTRKIEDFYQFLTFHQSYSYEEFVEGIVPAINDEEDCSTISYQYNKGLFKEICQEANSDPDNNYLLIIDEINRGNISKIFGELITLIEEDKRITPNGDINFENTITKDEQLLVSLPYTKLKFGVPSNLYILGTMNTSDRSIASIDIALRRRFKFKEMMPDSKLVADFGIDFNNIFISLNNKIRLLLDRDHQIGHSYFINTKYNNGNGNNNTETLKNIWFTEILPLLNEYFYCDWDKLKLIIPGFIKELKIPEYMKEECDGAAYEFKTSDEIDNFEAALKQENFE